MAKVSKKQIAGIVFGLIQQGTDSKRVTNMLAEYLLSERRTRELDAILREVSAMRAKAGTIEATTTSAFPLSSEVKQQIKKAFTTNGDKVVLNEIIDAYVVGGVRVETTDQKLDLTVRNKLNQLKAAAA